MLQIKFGEYIKQERMKLDISGRDLSNRIGKSSSYISSIEKGQFIPNYETMLKLFDILNINLSIKDLNGILGVETIKVNVLVMPSHNVKLNINLPSDIEDKLYELAKNEGRTQSSK